MPLATEGVGLAWVPDAHANAAIRRNHLENDFECRIVEWLQLIMILLGDRDADDGQGDPPQVMADLQAKLLINVATKGPFKEALCS